MTLPILYNCPPSGNCYKVRLFAALTGIELDIQDVDLVAGAHKTAAFTALNPWQQVPVLQDGETVIWDSQAILVYLAEKYGKTDWWPADPATRAAVIEWLSVSVNEIQHGPADARLVKLFDYPLRYDDAVRNSQRTLKVIDQHLSTQKWLSADRPTIADCAAYPYLALAPEGDIALDPYPSLRRWIDNMEKLPGYVPVDH
ncbi:MULTISPECIES: glutathione S-transferase family protein [Acetobacteraceae]|uniref:Protein GstA-like n=6 Tax=cellular organisms TaxID=131567 RepID=A0A6P4F9Y0_DRORH|nr:MULTISPECIES: glutathione S-transferase [Acetobacteraceae]ASL40959.1 glutathione S-transferase [Acetobacter oryzifermentans]ATJ91678.1 glutathione S-transferase [Acetobacter tropicalis]KAA8385217.1 glutathione S-transferase [Acetobacter tropicalis]KAA8386556.1 glutathione S-transferase [Acetobacter sp. DmW_136]KAA8389788.1 glutathione S-transferase [Acetobacter tropicalis]